MRCIDGQHLWFVIVEFCNSLCTQLIHDSKLWRLRVLTQSWPNGIVVLGLLLPLSGNNQELGAQMVSYVLFHI
jgi:hypothetical protein